MDILLDLDGVLTNFVQSALHAHNAVQPWPKGCKSIQELLGVDNETLFRYLPKNVYSFMPAMPDARMILQEVMKYDRNFHICSAMRCPAKYLGDLVSGKVHWCQGFIGPHFTRIQLIDNKTALAKPNVLLIDDDQENVRQFIEAGGAAILYPRPWNDRDETNAFENFATELKDVFEQFMVSQC